MGGCSVSPNFSMCFTFLWVSVAMEQLPFLALFLEVEDDAPCSQGKYLVMRWHRALT